jgi:hypothetical protein
LPPPLVCESTISIASLAPLPETLNCAPSVAVPGFIPLKWRPSSTSLAPPALCICNIASSLAVPIT